MQKSVLIFEPCLGAISGHWENLAENLVQGFENQGFKVVLFGNENQSQLHNKMLSVVPHFNQLPYLAYDTKSIIISARERYFHSFLSINIDDFDPHPLLVFPTLYPPILEAALSWLIKLVEYGKISPHDINFIFQFPPVSCIYHLQNLLKASPFSKIYAVSSQLAKIFQDQYDLPIKVLPMPINKTKLNFQESSNQPKEKKSLKIGYVGHTSLEKGFYFLHPLTELFHAHPVEFHYHLNLSDTEFEKAAQAFRNSPENVHCYWGHLSKQEINELIVNLDILLLPYNPRNYAAMPSAMFSEALLLGKVMVIPANTWLSEQAELYQAGVTTFSEHTLASIQKALGLAIEKHDQLQIMSEVAREPFNEYHNVDNFVKIILENREQATF
jgi:hypothetical protein